MERTFRRLPGQWTPLWPLLGAILFLAAACTEAATPDHGPPSATPAVPTVDNLSKNTSGPSSTLPPSLPKATVTRVIDGDTIAVSVDGGEMTLRYIGIDTPETLDPRRPLECLAQEASDYNERLVLGQVVGLEKDVSETDQFGRLLRYVWLGGDMVNATLVREGYAYASTYPPDVKYQGLLASLQSEAREAGRGLWGGACAETPAPTPPVAIPGTCEYSGTAEPRIKGNISVHTGEKIYHVPGGEFYDGTVVNEAKGER